ncbi:MAG: Choline-sulfatase [uncultured Thermomicrobiales bacterium]|uniref:Choline-sulfatase n=1 Tax=uncultured Thermomicrobiales bacterium TaxID=1645740 RepID=A0A6J4UVK9_9BACT|nr:MAG: Choline-sulfatase [uncultured Thermomicrobiales bacterium]
MTVAQTSTPRTNVLWVFGDQHRAQACGHAGDPNVRTPHLDRLAAGGTTFAAVMGTPLCSPCRGSLLTGRYPHRCVPGHEFPLPAGQPTIATAFRAAGYRTAYFGKWHLDGWHERDGRAALHIVPPDRRGDFDDWLGYENNNRQWDCWVHGGAGDDASHERLPGYETDALTDRLIAWLRARGRAAGGGDDRPFFAALSVQPPHDPYVAPAEWMARHTPGAIRLRPNVPEVPWVVERARRDLAGYYAMIENLDWNLGRIRDALAELGLADDTQIVFFSDHGDLHGSHGQFGKTAPWEEAIRVPFVVGGPPGYRNRIGRSPIPLNHVDVAPTTLGLCGIATPAWMDGTDYSHHCLHGRPAADEPDSAFLQLVVPTGHGDSVDRPWRGVVTRDGWKYVALEGQPWLLFNLRDDPHELANLAHNTRFAAARRALHERLAAWLADTGDRFALPEV